MPTEPGRKALSRLMYLAFCELRSLALDGRIEQAKDLADAFHNLPLLMHTNEFSFSVMRTSLDRYRQKYPGDLSADYLGEWEKMQINTTAQ